MRPVLWLKRVLHVELVLSLRGLTRPLLGLLHPLFVLTRDPSQLEHPLPLTWTVAFAA